MVRVGRVQGLPRTQSAHFTIGIYIYYILYYEGGGGLLREVAGAACGG